MFALFFFLAILTLIFPTVRLPLVDLAPSDLFLLCSFGWLLLESFAPLRGRRQTIPLHSLWLPAMLILLGGIIASAQAARPATSIAITIKIWFVLCVWVSMGIVMVRRGFLTPILVTLVIAGCVNASVGLIDLKLDTHFGDLISGNTL